MSESFAMYYPSFDQLWDYNQPQKTEETFKGLLNELKNSDNKSHYFQLLTQISRTLGLQKKFDEAHKFLDEVERQLADNDSFVKIRYLLERGRVFNSSKKQEQAQPLFENAFTLGSEKYLDFYSIDAAHMMAIVESDPLKQMEWNLKAVDLAENSKDQKAQTWLGGLYNNIGWTYHDTKEYEKALEIFKKALQFREKMGDESSIRIAKWSIARALRSLNKADEALKIQTQLLQEFDKDNSKDGYVFEELGELYLIKNNPVLSKKYLGLAYEELSKDSWLVENEPERILRLKERGRV